ncbi:MAG: methyl-accepting chemotaxis protein [Myxococcota bacterium]
MRFRNRLLLILLPALLGTVVLGGWKAGESQHTVRSLETLQERGVAARRAGDAAHRLQIERGLSSGFLASRGASFSGELREGRVKSDGALRDVKPPVGLAALRADVDAQRLAPLASFQRYTALIEGLLTEQTRLATDADDPAVARLANALDLLSLAKESAGRERATLNGAFAAGRLEPEVYVRFVTVVAAQDAYLARFERFASDAGRAALAQEQGGEAVKQALALRAQALAAGSGGALSTPAKDWFEASTRRIERLRVVEQLVGAELDAALDGQLAAAQRTRALALGVALLVTAVALALGLFQSRQVLAQLGGEPTHAVEVMRRIAGGDLRDSVSVRTGDSASILAEAAGMQRQLGEIISSIRATAGAVSLSSGEIAAATSDLAQRTAAEAATVEQASATLQQLTTAVNQNAASAREALSLAAQAAEASARGGEVVQQLRNTVQDVDKVVAQVRDIVSTIDEVAYQTNLLALNAAVEAGRAGPEGRGFGVVATEVRALSRHTDELAKQIGALMNDSTRRIRTGVSQAGDAEQALQRAVAGAQRVDGLLRDVARASGEQAQGLTYLSRTLASIEDGTQRNAAVVEESTAAATSLRDQARTLERAVEHFRVAQPAPAAAPAPRGWEPLASVTPAS